MKYLVYISLFLLIACGEIRSYPDTPIITYKEFNYQDSSLVFSFIDGDGDFGFLESDTVDSISNVFTPLFKKEDGSYVRLDTMKDGFHYRITDIPEPQGQDKTLKGEIKIRLNWMGSMFPDTFRFKFYIIDRDKNISNTDSTPDLYSALLGK